MCPAHLHRISQFPGDLVDVALDALFAAAVDRRDEGTADEHTVRAQSQCLEDVHAGADAAIDQNFVPVVDDRNVFIGMVRRTVILRDVYNKYGAKLDKPRQNTYTHA